LNSSYKTHEVETLYDYHSDTLGIRVKNDYEYKSSIELEEDLILDFNQNNQPAALKILNVSKILKVDKSALNNIVKLNMNLKITKEVINLNLHIAVLFRNETLSKSINGLAINNINAPAMKTKLVA
jgi:uncharacterized protein YuzE